MATTSSEGLLQATHIKPSADVCYLSLAGLTNNVSRIRHGIRPMILTYTPVAPLMQRAGYSLRVSGHYMEHLPEK